MVLVVAFLKDRRMDYRAGCFRNRGISKKKIILEGKEVSRSGINIYFFERKLRVNSFVETNNLILNNYLIKLIFTKYFYEKNMIQLIFNN